MSSRPRARAGRARRSSAARWELRSSRYRPCGLAGARAARRRAALRSAKGWAPRSSRSARGRKVRGRAIRTRRRQPPCRSDPNAAGETRNRSRAGPPPKSAMDPAPGAQRRSGAGSGIPRAESERGRSAARADRSQSSRSQRAARSRGPRGDRRSSASHSRSCGDRRRRSPAARSGTWRPRRCRGRPPPRAAPATAAGSIDRPCGSGGPGRRWEPPATRQ